MEPLKECVSCKKSKPKTAEYFYYRNKSKGYLSSWCKECRKRNRNLESENAAQRKRRSIAPKTPRIESKRKHIDCIDCGIEIIGTRSHKRCPSCRKKHNQAEKRLDKALRKKRLRAAMPSWADKEEIKRIYAERPNGCDVDHVIPIAGEKVCGLHVPSNLQYLSREENLKKGNKFNDGNHYSLEHDGCM